MNVIELFSGAGGATEGILSAGATVQACVEYGPTAHATALAAGHPSILADVRHWPGTWRGPRPDLLWASPPCQAFSTAGERRGEADARNGWPWLIDAVDALNPTWVIAENVQGLTYHASGCPFRDGTTPNCAGCYWIGGVLPAFARRFRRVEWRVLDAAEYGAPQARRRVFMVAGPEAYPWPRPTHGPTTGVPVVTLGAALGLEFAPGSILDRPAPTLTIGGHASSRNVISASARVRKAYHDAGLERLTVEQCGTIQGFRPGYPWTGSKVDQYHQVGNAVVPAVARALVGAIPPPVRSLPELLAFGERTGAAAAVRVSSGDSAAWDDLYASALEAYPGLPRLDALPDL